MLRWRLRLFVALRPLQHCRTVSRIPAVTQWLHCLHACVAVVVFSIYYLFSLILSRWFASIQKELTRTKSELRLVPCSFCFHWLSCFPLESASIPFFFAYLLLFACEMQPLFFVYVTMQIRLRNLSGFTP